jgi:hypothetical protein
LMMAPCGAVATVSCGKVQVLNPRFCAIDLPTASSTFSQTITQRLRKLCPSVFPAATAIVSQNMSDVPS